MIGSMIMMFTMIWGIQIAMKNMLALFLEDLLYLTLVEEEQEDQPLTKILRARNGAILFTYQGTKHLVT